MELRYATVLSVFIKTTDAVLLAEAFSKPSGLVFSAIVRTTEPEATA
jgi:hypothetical protein